MFISEVKAYDRQRIALGIFNSQSKLIRPDYHCCLVFSNSDVFRFLLIITVILVYIKVSFIFHVMIG